MSMDQIVQLLIAERDRLNRAIEALSDPIKRRGRPPKNPLAAVAPSSAESAPKRQRRTFTPAQRKEVAERMRKMWAAKKKARS